MFADWMKLAFDTSMLAVEAQQVIGLRMLRLAGGGSKAAREASGMITEKMIAAGEAMALTAAGKPPGRVIGHYRKKVRANRRRLTRRSRS